MIDLISGLWNKLEKNGTKGFHVYNEKGSTFDLLSFAGLVKEAGRAAAFLNEKNIPNRVPVLFSAVSSREFILIWLALLWKGCTPIPMPPADALIGDNQYEHRIKDIIPHFGYYICYEREAHRIKPLASSRTFPLEIYTFESLFNSAWGDYDPGKIPERETLTLDDAAFYQFTSGSTSKPKGIIITYRNLSTNIADTWERLEIDTEKERIGSWLPLYHDMGLVGFFLGGLFTQTELVLLSPLFFAKRPLRFLEVIEEFQIGYCSMPNFALEWIIRTLKRKKDFTSDLSSLRWIGVGAEPVNVNTLEQFSCLLSPLGLKEGVLSPCYGLAEATLAVSIEEPFISWQEVSRNGQRFPTVGIGLSHIEAVIKKDGDNVPGTIHIKGDGVAETALIEGDLVSLLDEEGYYNTKDIGCFENERLVILGREDEMFIMNGENIFPYDIENTLRESGLAARNRVVCFPIERDGKMEIIILYESRYKDEQISREICEHIIRILGITAVFVYPVPIKSIPVTSSGKIKRKAAKEQYLKQIKRKGEKQLLVNDLIQ